MVIDMNRLLEVITRVAPETFLSNDQVHCSRLFNYLMFVLRSVLTSGARTYFDAWSKKMHSLSENLGQFVAPVFATISNLYLGINKLSQQTQFDNLCQILTKVDSFDIQIFILLREVVINELPIDNPDEKKTLLVFDDMMNEIEILYNANKLRRRSSVGDQEEDKEEEYADSLCTICYSVDMDT